MAKDSDRFSHRGEILKKSFDKPTRLASIPLNLSNITYSDLTGSRIEGYLLENDFIVSLEVRSLFADGRVTIAATNVRGRMFGIRGIAISGLDAF